jgi:hypothetical protein
MSLRQTFSVRSILRPVGEVRLAFLTNRDDYKGSNQSPKLRAPIVPRFFSAATVVMPPEFSKPTIAMAKAMPREYFEYSNAILVPLAMRGDRGARTERLIREVMLVDSLSHEQATAAVKSLSRENRKYEKVYELPYNILVAVALGAGFGSFPMVFDLDTAVWFNENFVTAEMAEPEDLETVLEVGGWTWNWMEPPMGQLSFVMLALAWARLQMQHIGLKPYTEWMVDRRAAALAGKYPQYNKGILQDFATTDIFHDD